MAKRNKKTTKPEPIALEILEPPHDLTSTKATLAWAADLAHSLAWLYGKAVPTMNRPFAEDIRRAAVAAALDLQVVLDALAEDPGAQFVSTPNSDRMWLVIGRCYEGLDGEEQGRDLDEKLLPVVRAVRETYLGLT